MAGASRISSTSLRSASLSEVGSPGGRGGCFEEVRPQETSGLSPGSGSTGSGAGGSAGSRPGGS
ncbi:MAG: hypothetical protein F4X85_13140 [Acidimicrobiaceae bacterium]|nr:hypothetical protein [Acidimicrobiaceae bacterium]